MTTDYTTDRASAKAAVFEAEQALAQAAAQLSPYDEAWALCQQAVADVDRAIAARTREHGVSLLDPATRRDAMLPENLAGDPRLLRLTAARTEAQSAAE